MRISRLISGLCLPVFILTACSETELGLESTKIPILFSTSVYETEAISTRAADDNSEALIVNDMAAIKDKDITLFGAEYWNVSTRTWNFIDGWNAIVTEPVTGTYDFDYASGHQMKYFSPQVGLRYDFLAVFPAASSVSESGVSWSDRGAPLMNIKLMYRPDLMVATTTGVTKPSIDSRIPLNFEHKLVLVTFNIYKDIDSHQSGEPESHSIFLNKMTLAGKTMADFNPFTGEFSEVDAKTGATVRIPGYPYSTFEVEEQPKKIRDIFLFPSAVFGNELYDFDFELNENVYNVKLPSSNKKWEAGKHYTYNIKVVGSDVYIELGHEDDDMKLIQEKWDDEDKGEVTLG